MNILQLISSEGYYGAESMLLALARTLPSFGCGSIVGVFESSRTTHCELQDRAQSLGQRVVTLPCHGRWDRKAVQRLRALIKDLDVDVLHTHGYKADVYGYAAAWPDRVALVATCHNWPSKLLSMRAYAALDRWTLRHFDRVATPSEPIADKLKRAGVPLEKLRNIPNGVDMETFQNATPILRKRWSPANERLIGFVGRMVPDKGGAQLLAAAQSVLAVYPGARFVFVGEGPARQEWEALAAKLDIGSKVLFTGARADMPSVYAALDLVVLPSFQECMPMCLLESLAAGKPVVATAVGAVPKVVIPGVTGLLCDPGDVASLSAAVVRLLRDPGLAAAMGTRGRAHIARYYAAEAVGRHYIHLYKEALSNRNRQAPVSTAWQRSRP